MGVGKSQGLAVRDLAALQLGPQEVVDDSVLVALRGSEHSRTLPDHHLRVHEARADLVVLEQGRHLDHLILNVDLVVLRRAGFPVLEHRVHVLAPERLLSGEHRLLVSVLPKHGLEEGVHGVRLPESE